MNANVYQQPGHLLSLTERLKSMIQLQNAGLILLNNPSNQTFITMKMYSVMR